MDPKKIREQRAHVWAQMQEIRARSNDGMSAEDREAWDRAEAEMASLEADLQRAESAERYSTVDYRQILDVRTPADEVVTPEGDTVADYRAAFEMYVRHGIGELPADLRATFMAENRAQGVGTTTAGGFLVPAQFRDRLVERIRYYSGVRQVAEVIQTDNGAALPWPTNDDTSNVGAILAENTQDTELDLTLGQATLNVYMYTSKIVRVSLQLIQDSAIDIEEFLPRKLGERIGRAQNAHFTTGTGTAQPLGLITGGTAVQAATGNVTSFTYASLVDATARLDPGYLQGGNVAWMGSQAALAAARKLVDSQNRPLWEPSLQAGVPDNLLGYRFVLNNDVPVPAANAKSLAFGDFRAGYVVRDTTDVQVLRLTERYADYLQVGFLGFQRSGGTPQDVNAYTVLQNSAT